MVGADAHGDVGHQVPPGQGRGMPIHDAAAGACRPELLQDPGGALQDRRDVHHLGQSQDPRPRQERAHLGWAQHGAGLLPRRGGNARGGHEEEVQGEAPAGRQQPIEAGDAQDVAHLVGVGDQGGRPVGHDQAGELGRGQQRALQVHVRVDQARQDGPARQRDRLMRRPVVGPDAGDPAVGDDDRRRFDPLGKDVDDPPAGQEQVGGLVAAGDADAPLEEVQVAVHGCLGCGPSDLPRAPV